MFWGGGCVSLFEYKVNLVYLSLVRKKGVFPSSFALFSTRIVFLWFNVAG